MLPNPILFGLPFHVWLGITTYTLIIIQILIGTRILKVPFWIHTKVNWMLILVIASIHALYGLSIYSNFF